MYYSLNSWIVSQGGNEIFGAKLVVSNKIPAAMIAIPICAVLLILTSLIGRLYALRGGVRWQERIPVVGFELINTISREGTVYQGAMIAVFSLLPALAMIYFWHSFLTAKVMLNDGSKNLIDSVWDWSKLTTLNDPARICSDFNKDLVDPCMGNGTLLPGLEATIFAVLTVAAILTIGLHWHSVIRA